MVESNIFNSSNVKNKNFLCGVVEGFYGRPWTAEQRKDLFHKLKKWEMDCYLYAPKDDYKHRAFWRDLYTVEEAEHLTRLITAARESGVIFYYALSPGLDITYSSVKEVTALKRKLEQVSQFGCQAFALLFDDIEPEMSEEDKEVFQSFAHAQVSVTNDIFQHLNQPHFLLCPTQYCATRATPNVATSEYLSTLGSKLAQGIEIMWTGPRVISRTLTIKSIEEITEILKRPPVIWDNLHANDYDQKRVFLGPYSGRSTDLIPKLKGVLTNPNCEYNANFIAIHTLAQWSRCNVDGKRDLSLNDSVSADIKLETETEDGVFGEDVPSTLSANMYHPRRALKNAVREWLPEFSKRRAVFGVIAKPQPTVASTIPIPIIPSVNTCMSLTSSTTSSVTSLSTIAAPLTVGGHSSHLQALAEVCSSVIGSDGSSKAAPIGPIMNSLVSETKVVSEPIILSNVVTSTGETLISKSLRSSPEPMEYNSLATNSCSNRIKISRCDGDTTQKNSNSSKRNLIDGDSSIENNENHELQFLEKALISEKNLPMKQSNDLLSHEDLLLLCDLFYLPFEHGCQGIQLLQEFQWLKSNADFLIVKDKFKSGQTQNVEEWITRATKMNDMSQAVDQLLQKLLLCNNRELLFDLYPYIWDMRGVVSLLNSYIRWLALGNFPASMTTYTQGTYTWFSNGWKESFMSGNQEPWVFRGGLTADLQRLIPVDSGNDLYVYKVPEMPNNKIYSIRPYKPSDQEAIYAVCHQINNYSSATADRLVGGFLTMSPEYCMVVEDESEIVGYALSSLNIKLYNQKLSQSWIPEMQTKYPLQSISGDMPLNEQEAIQYFHTFEPDVPEQLDRMYPSRLTCLLLPIVSDQSVSKRLITCLLAALRSSGSFGAHVLLTNCDKEAREFYLQLGFVDFIPPFEKNLTTITMCRNF